ncbi:MAG: cytochrome b/b6 domain-containing protein [Porticoccaceae bacterium]|nr:cytochrome b/b6 domain-containing protein [Porticoccaceae bacterium]
MTTNVKLWDPLVRLFHWSLALSFFANYFFTEEGEDWHRWIGYYAFAWLLVRIVWGFTSGGAASWRECWPTASRLKSHLKLLVSGGVHRHLGHSPIGALVMIMMMTAMFGLGISGYMMEEIDMFWGEDWVENLHESIANILAALVSIHIIAAIVESIRLGENLPLSMVTGKRKNISLRNKSHQ